MAQFTPCFVTGGSFLNHFAFHIACIIISIFHLVIATFYKSMNYYGTHHLVISPLTMNFIFLIDFAI